MLNVTQLLSGLRRPGSIIPFFAKNYVISLCIMMIY